MKTNENKPIAWIALLLTIVGLLGPFVIAIFASDDQAIGFGIISVLLALILGVISWQHLLGRVSVTVCLISLILFGIAYYRFTVMRDLILDRSAKTTAENQIKKHAEQGADGNRY
jgi:phosphate/sulfate permease